MHYPCFEVRNRESCKNLRGPSLSRTIPCSACMPETIPETRFETTLHREDSLVLLPEELRDIRRDKVGALQVLAEAVFAMHRDESEQTISCWANIFERIDQLREALRD